MALVTAVNWLYKADNLSEYIVSIDFEDGKLPTYLKAFNFNEDIKLIVNNHSESAIKAINLTASNKSTGDILIIISDDMDCPEHWDTLLLESIGDKTDFCAKALDGHQDWLITLPIMDRTYYNRFGYVYNPVYQHMYADLEMTCVAWMLDRYIKIPLTFEHKHPRYSGEQMDETYKRNLPTWITGKETFKKRIAENFGIEPVKRYKNIETGHIYFDVYGDDIYRSVNSKITYTENEIFKAPEISCEFIPKKLPADELIKQGIRI